MGFSGAIFDLDGVLTDTARLHLKAWRETLKPMRLSEEDYARHFDGRKREDGLKAYLRAKNADANETWRKSVMARKDARYRELLLTETVRVYDDARQLIESLRGKVKLAVASSSKNARMVLDSAGLKFDAVVDGSGPAKPHSYVLAAKQMGVSFSECAVFEDSPDALMSAINAGCKYAVFMKKGRS